ncbi:MAG TPA: DUF4124 domain-containing protein [Steroidobacteraceae bacterium]|nr:DUF4124 domain-containing protein [Steroidobacteraceae bacterium]
MRRLLFTLMSLACTAAFATTIYKWVDENGVVHYSDQPHPNAQKLQITGAQTFSSSAAAVPAPNQSDDANAQTNPYRGCVIASPQDQQSLPNAQSVFLRVQSDPQPRPGDRVFITLDGQGVNGGQATGLSYNVTPIERGAHSVQAQIRGPGDQVLCQTPTVTFYVQQPNLFSPGGPNNGPPNPNPRPR